LTKGAAGLLEIVRGVLALDARAVSARARRPVMGRASLDRCDATCCKGGVALSIGERDAILRHREAVADAMAASPRPGADRPGFDWFSRRARRDPDFLEGRSLDTRVVAGGCVFLRADGLCAVHVASEKVAKHPYALKPAYCVLFPLCVEKGALDVCRGSYTRRPDCCSPVRRGTRTPLALFAPVAAWLRSAPAHPQGARERSR
jgi:Fe-S-cluster containining protein